MNGRNYDFAFLDEFPPDSPAAGLWLAAQETDTHRFDLVRERVQPGRTFSHEAMDKIYELIQGWIECRIMARWKQTGEPPTICTISVKVDVG